MTLCSHSDLTSKTPGTNQLLNISFNFHIDVYLYTKHCRLINNKL
jgi:hypothetical protein